MWRLCGVSWLWCASRWYSVNYSARFSWPWCQWTVNCFCETWPAIQSITFPWILTVSLTIPVTAESSQLIGVACWVCPISWMILFFSTSPKRATSFAPASEAPTNHRMDARRLIGQLKFIGLSLLVSHPRKKHPEAHLFALDAPRKEASEWMLRIVFVFILDFCILKSCTITYKLINCFHW